MHCQHLLGPRATKQESHPTNQPSIYFTECTTRTMLAAAADADALRIIIIIAPAQAARPVQSSSMLKLNNSLSRCLLSALPLPPLLSLLLALLLLSCLNHSHSLSERFMLLKLVRDVCCGLAVRFSAGCVRWGRLGRLAGNPWKRRNFIPIRKCDLLNSSPICSFSSPDSALLFQQMARSLAQIGHRLSK